MTAVERIDPGILADIIIKATAIQESANGALRAKGSVYRIGEITIGAAIPPSIQFSIERIDDPNAKLFDSTSLLARAEAAGAIAKEAIVSLDGTAVDPETLEAVAEEE